MKNEYLVSLSDLWVEVCTNGKKNHLIPLLKANLKSNTIKCTHKAFIAGLDKGGSADRSRRFRWMKILKKNPKITCTVNVVPGYHKKESSGERSANIITSLLLWLQHTINPLQESNCMLLPSVLQTRKGKILVNFHLKVLTSVFFFVDKMTLIICKTARLCSFVCMCNFQW